MPSLYPHKSKRIEDWFATGEEFEDTLQTAISNTDESNGVSLDFLADIKEKWDARGMTAYMSEGQFNWLNRLAGND